MKRNHANIEEGTDRNRIKTRESDVLKPKEKSVSRKRVKAMQMRLTDQTRQ
jgi:hypothetical protein